MPLSNKDREWIEGMSTDALLVAYQEANRASKTKIAAMREEITKRMNSQPFTLDDLGYIRFIVQKDLERIRPMRPDQTVYDDPMDDVPELVRRAIYRRQIIITKVEQVMKEIA